MFFSFSLFFWNRNIGIGAFFKWSRRLVLCAGRFDSLKRIFIFIFVLDCFKMHADNPIDPDDGIQTLDMGGKKWLHFSTS